MEKGEDTAAQEHWGEAHGAAWGGRGDACEDCQRAGEGHVRGGEVLGTSEARGENLGGSRVLRKVHERKVPCPQLHFTQCTKTGDAPDMQGISRSRCTLKCHKNVIVS